MGLYLKRHRLPDRLDWIFDYFAGAVAGVADVAGVASVLLFAFLFFFTCFFAVVAGVVPFAGVEAACAASDKPAVASVNDSPRNTAEIFFMVLFNPFRGACFLPLYVSTNSVLIPPECTVKLISLEKKCL